MKTLVDCGCGTKVHADGSGVEIYYCPLHAAAPELLEELRDATQHMIGLKAYLATCATDVIVENLETTIAALRKQIESAEAAIRKAQGE